MPGQANPAQIINLLERILSQQTSAASWDWLMKQRKKLSESAGQKLFLAFSMASRYFADTPLVCSPGQQTQAAKIRDGFMPQCWNQLQAARALLLLEIASMAEDEFTNTLSRLAETADVAEQIALYAALPLLPHPLALRKRAAEGIRSNITLVFDAIALHNPYPADYLEEGPWNQMVVKAVFLNRPLYQIYGADTRSNPALAQMLLDFVHERWAANRSTTPELWRFIGPYIQADSFAAIEKLSREGSMLEKQAVLLASSESAFPPAGHLLRQYGELAQQIKAGSINWTSIGQQYHHE